MAPTTVADRFEAPITRAAAKRKAQEALVEENQPSVKRRTVFGDVTALANNKRVAAPPPPQKPKLEIKKPAREDEDPQLCGPYASDIYAYLRRMEVEPKRRPLTDYMATIQKDC